MLGLVRRTVDDNRDTATALVQDRSRWWIASTIDRRVAGMAVDGVLSLLDELRTEDSDLRRGFETAFDGVIDGLEREGALARAIGEGRRAPRPLAAPSTRLALRFAEALRDRLAARIDDRPRRRSPRRWPRWSRDLAARLARRPRRPGRARRPHRRRWRRG